MHNNKDVIVTASSAIAAQQMMHGRTAHSTFGWSLAQVSPWFRYPDWSAARWSNLVQYFKAEQTGQTTQTGESNHLGWGFAIDWLIVDYIGIWWNDWWIIHLIDWLIDYWCDADWHGRQTGSASCLSPAVWPLLQSITQSSKATIRRKACHIRRRFQAGATCSQLIWSNLKIEFSCSID